MIGREIIKQLFLFVFVLFPTLGRSQTSYNVSEISHLEVNAAITPATLDYLRYQFKKAPDSSLILIKLNTPGGLISTTKDIITLIGVQDKPIAIWITPEGASASSAGAIIAAAAHFILMSPGTNLGAATPVGLGQDLKESDGKAKALNDLKAMVRSLSHSRNRPAAPFEKMIETAESYTVQEAMKEKIIDGVVSSDTSLRSILDGKNFTLKGKIFELKIPSEVLSKNYDPTVGQNILNVLANPSTAYFLFLIGIALLYFELQAPGGFIAGGIGISFIVLSAISFQVLPLNWGALVLLIVGVVLLILEVYITSYGLLALGGIASFVTGSLFLFHGEAGFISVNYPVLISTLLGIAFSVAIISWYLIRERKKNKTNQDFFLPVGSKGTVIKKTSEDSTYLVKVRGEIWKGFSDSELFPKDLIEVISIDSEKLLAHIKRVHKE